MIDWDRISELRDEVGAEALGEVVELFFAEIGETLRSLDSGDSHTSAAEAFHFLKGSALNIGLRDLAGLCQEEEETLRRRSGAQPNLSAVLQCLSASKRELGAGHAFDKS